MSSILLILDFFSYTTFRELQPHHLTGLAHHFIESLGIHDPQPPAPTCNCIEDSTGHNGLDNPEYCPTDVKSSQLSQKIQTPLALRVDCSWFSGPLKVPNQFLGLCHMELQMILLAPRNKGVHHYWVLHFIPPTDESNQSRKF